MPADATARRSRQMKFAVFMMMDGNYHLAGWRLPGAHADAGQNVAHWIEFARILERGKLDMLFIADNISPQGVDHRESMSKTARAMGFEPFTLLAALSSVTSRLGLAATAATTWNEPYTVARMFASLDHLSGGRAGWNLVTGRNPEDAKNFSRDEHMPYADRYARAEEFVDVVKGLWDSYEDDALLRDKSSGAFFDPDKMHLLNHKGARFAVKGPLSVSRPPQGHPVVVQAGESEPARELSARVADVVFTAQASLAAAQAFYADVKGRLAKFGRSPDSLKILPGVNIYVGATAAQAEEKFQELQSLVPPMYALRQLSLLLGGVDLSRYDLDGPMPQIEGNVTRANPHHFLAFADDKSLTLREVALRASAAKAHWIVKGSAQDVADQLQEWFDNGAADGFNLLPPDVPGTLTDFTELVVPELRRRGLFRSEYEGRTLRENLGLPRPANTLAAARVLQRGTG
jgi:FMN-dependent oxidoreductase (nitrilotriacetate monooxygenase family)